MAILLIRCANESKEPHRIELKLGEINKEKEKLERVEEMIRCF